MMDDYYAIVSGDEECLRRIISRWGDDDVELRTEDTPILVIKKEVLDTMPSRAREYMLDFALGYVEGWQAAKE